MTVNQSALPLAGAAVSDIRRQVPMNMAHICRDWLTNQCNGCWIASNRCGRLLHQVYAKIQLTNCSEYICLPECLPDEAKPVYWVASRVIEQSCP